MGAETGMSDGQEDGWPWGKMLDQLSDSITKGEQAGIRQASVDRGDPSHLKDLHNHVGRLLVK